MAFNKIHTKPLQYHDVQYLQSYDKLYNATPCVFHAHTYMYIVATATGGLTD